MPAADKGFVRTGGNRLIGHSTVRQEEILTESEILYPQPTRRSFHTQRSKISSTTEYPQKNSPEMYLSSSILSLLTAGLATAAIASKTTTKPTSTTSVKPTATCTPPSVIFRDYYNFSLRVNGHSEGQPELEIAWDAPQFPTSPGHFILSTTPMISPLLTYLNGNDGGKLCDQGDLCSDVVKNSADQFDGLGFFGQDQNAQPPFEVYGICDADGNPTYAIRPRADSVYTSFAVTSFAAGSQVMLRKKGQVGIGSDVTLKIVQH
ncbi:MAG: hypothetical protein Q9220_004380 [cf. Caloplaca sp. 1 TL-2023]